MTSIEEEANSNTWPESVIELSSKEPLHFTAYRVYVILEKHGRVKSTSVPFIHRVWFLPLILGYIFTKRITSIFSREANELDGHVFSLHSTSAYKTEAFLQLAKDFTEMDNQDVTLYGVDEAIENFNEQMNGGDITETTFGKSFEKVPIITLIKKLPHLWGIARGLAKKFHVRNLGRQITAFNFLVTEYIKFEGLKRNIGDIDSFHTYAPMPYQLKSVDNDLIYTYQHGIEVGEGNRSFSIPKYAPVTYFIWGSNWLEQFRQKSHPDSPIIPVGSPRYDSLFERREERDVDIDVLFVSGSHVIDSKGYDAQTYRELVDAVVNLCEKQGWNLKIKLHPIEEANLYVQWGYNEYITEVNDISALLLRSDVAVTDLSSAFTESLVLDTPMVVSQSSRQVGFQSFGPAPGLAFPDTLSETIHEIQRLKGTHIPVDEINKSGIIHIGESSDKIRNYCINEAKKLT